VENAVVQLPIFSSYSPELIAAIASNSKSRKFFNGNELTTQGHIGSSIIVVLDGLIEMFVHGDRVGSLKQGQSFGETLLLGIETCWTATLIVSGSCTVAELTKDGFEAALSAYPAERAHFAKVAAHNKDVLDHGTHVRRCMVFRGLSGETMNLIDQNLVRRLYFPGEQFLMEGTKGDELFMLIRGIARVEIANRFVRLEKCGCDGYEDMFINMGVVTKGKYGKGNSTTDDLVCFGELGLLGMQESRTATVIAESICHMRIMYRPVFCKLLDEGQESIQTSQLMQFILERYTGASDGPSVEPLRPALELFQQVRVFKDIGCSSDFLEFLTQHLEDQLFLKGQKIIDENNPDDRCMYLINRGKAKVIKNGVDVAVLHSGAVVGEIIVLGLAHKRTATVVAEETCFMKVLHQPVVVRGLELYPEDRSKVLIAALNDPQSPQSPPTSTLSSHFTSPLGDASDAGAPDINASKKTMAHVLKSSPVLSNVSVEFIEELSLAAMDRIYMPGDMIIEQGTKGDSMLVMVSGTAAVYVTDPTQIGDIEDLTPKEVSTPPKYSTSKHSMTRVGSLRSGSVGGELAMLGVAQVRSATIFAETICSMWEIAQEEALPIINRHQDSQEYFVGVIVDHLERTVPQRISSLPLFRGFDRKFRTLLSIYCERVAYFPEQQIVREGHTGEKLFVVNFGRARLEKKGVQVKLYNSGTCFGCSVMLGIHKVYIGTLIALQTCHFLTVSRQSYMVALEQYPSHAAAQTLKKTEQLASEALKEAVVRTATRKLILARYRSVMEVAAGPEALVPGVPHLTETEILERFIHAWSQRVKYCKKRRNQLQIEDHQRRIMMESWMKKRVEAMKHAEKLRRMHTKGLEDGADEDETVKLPPISPNATNRHEIASVIKSWPSPRPSPHYKLRVYSVLNSVVKSPTEAATLLPALKNSDDSRGRDRWHVCPISDTDHSSEDEVRYTGFQLAKARV